MSPKEVYILLRKKCPDFFPWVTGLAVLTSSPLPASLTLFQRHCHSCCFFNMPGTFFPQISVHGLPLFFHFSAQISSPRSRLPWHPAHPDILSFCPALFLYSSLVHREYTFPWIIRLFEALREMFSVTISFSQWACYFCTILCTYFSHGTFFFFFEKQMFS